MLLERPRDELVRRATAIALDSPGQRHDLGLPREIARRLDSSEQRALAIACAAGGCEDARRMAAVEFVAETVTTLVLENATEPGEARELVAEVATATAISPGAAALAVFVRALGTRDVAQLPPRLAMTLFLDLLLELGPAKAVSLWTVAPSGRLDCIASAGESPRSRRLRTAAHAVLDGSSVDSLYVPAVAVERWDRPFAAVVARGRPEASARLSVYLHELASALSPIFEREMLFERNTARERSLVSAGERRLVRLGFDLHDGPLQEVAALADDLRYARDQVTSILDDPEQSLVRGRFDDLEARLASLDRGLRDIAHSVRATSAVEQPLEHALRNEVDALSRSANIKTDLAVDGDVSTLTASQKIALFRVVQESLCNIRKHSGASRVRVRVRSVPLYVSVVVSDNGRGFANARVKDNGRLGLAGVVERVRLLGGDVEIASNPGEGVLVRATLPRWRPAEEPATPVYAVTA